MLERNELYFCASHGFNDPFDSRGRRSFEFTSDEELIKRFVPLECSRQNISEDEAVAYLKDMISSEMRRMGYLNANSALFQKLVLQGFGICCFSEIPNDILMWSHYAGGHTGFCLEFARADDNFLGYARKVTYPEDDEFPSVDYWIQDPNRKLEEFTKIVLTKAKHWAYESEWRAVDRPEEISHQYVGHVGRYEPDILSGIIFGLCMSVDQRGELQSLLAGRPVKFYEARAVKNRFQIEIVEI